MLELTGDHVEKLTPEDLRELVFKLCEAELRQHNLPIAAVTAGGNQTASDGGVDVRVDLAKPTKLDFIPRAQTVFQVKCEDIPASKVVAEMRPKGMLRASIVQAIEAQGAYIIVSSKGTVAHSRLEERRAAMRTAVKAVLNAETVYLDFYDRNRLANWVRGYPGVEQWMRARVGAPLSGWQGYGNWTGDKTDSPYQKDELGRVLSKSSGNAETMSVELGINAIRERLAKPGESVRLIGLSGTGKTRLVQALFEAGVGALPLDTAIAVYTDQGRSPQPSARDMVQYLGANGLRAIVVVDNCNPVTHLALTKIIATYPACLSLITVEYDVMDDEPEETQVFELTGSSPTVLEGILARQAPHISQNDLVRIVEFSDGNARVAIALAQTVKSGQTLGVLNHRDLFKRLFMQNQEPNEELLRAAEVCSLVYSFDGEALAPADAELPILATLGNLQVSELFRHVAELKRRKLVQTRSKWRAVLPHALANRLAKQALENLPQSDIMSALQGHDPLLAEYLPRLHVSQSDEAAGRRLLDSLEHAVAPIQSYHCVTYGLLDNGMPAGLYRAILLKLAEQPTGLQIAVDSLGMEFHRCASRKSAPPVELASLGRELLSRFNFDVAGNNFEYHLTEVADISMQGPDATPAAVTLCQRFAEALQDYRRGADSLRKLAETLFKHQPVAALDAFLGQPPTALGYSSISQFSLSGKSVVNAADAGALLAWIKEEPAVRAPLLAAEIEIHCTDSTGTFAWSPLAASLLEMAPNRQAVLDGFANRFYPRCWSGSIANVLRPYQELAKRLTTGVDAEIAVWASGQLALMAKRISQERWSEQRTDERFE